MCWSLVSVQISDKRIEDHYRWRNPYVFISQDTVALRVEATSTYRTITADQLADVMINLPPAAWPDGKIVAVEEQHLFGKGVGSYEQLVRE